MDAFRIFAARAGSRCWCGREAAVTRQGEGIESSYCSEHWQLWWEYALPETASLVITEAS